MNWFFNLGSKSLLGVMAVLTIGTAVFGLGKVAAMVTNGSLDVNQVKAATSSSCIVTIFGKQYDVTSLRQTHSGGDIFVCGTDMTTKYQNQHGTNVSRMQQYLVTVPTPTPTATPAPTATPTPSMTPTPQPTPPVYTGGDDDEEYEDDEDEEEVEDDNDDDEYHATKSRGKSLERVWKAKLAMFEHIFFLK